MGGILMLFGRINYPIQLNYDGRAGFLVAKSLKKLLNIFNSQFSASGGSGLGLRAKG
jgi:hypothetical protein